MSSETVGCEICCGGRRRRNDGCLLAYHLDVVNKYGSRSHGKLYCARLELAFAELHRIFAPLLTYLELRAFQSSLFRIYERYAHLVAFHIGSAETCTERNREVACVVALRRNEVTRQGLCPAVRRSEVSQNHCAYASGLSYGRAGPSGSLGVA